MKKCLVILALALILLIVVKNAHAADFSSKYNVTYELQSEGYTKVTQEIKVTNLVAEFYLSKFTIDLGPQQVVNAQAIEKNKELRTSLIQNATSSAITVDFGDKTIGKGSTKTFTLTYESVNTLQKSGNLKTLSLPKITGNSVTDYDVTLLIPDDLGEADSISPEPQEKVKEGGHTKIVYTKEQVLDSPINLVLGSEQYYTLGLTYHLKNPQNKSVFTEIALPMNTAEQKVMYENINPSPASIAVDEDGNYIARYTMKPKQEIDVQFTGKVIVLKQKQYQDPKLTQQQYLQYTQKQKYWETDDLNVATLAAKLRTPEQIYQYVVDTLSYDTGKLGDQEVPRQGAAQVLKAGQSGVCMEFTDLFIALARAAGIPAREVNGFAYTTDPISRPLSLSQDILHSWPEYYDDERGWVQVDPTWQNTTSGVDYFNSFDLNHIAFVRKGLSSEYPYPAGSYKSRGGETRDVLVSLSDSKPDIREDYKVVAPEKQTVFAGKVLDLVVTIKNTGNTPLELPVEKKVVKKNENQTSKDIVVIPPYTQSAVSLIHYMTSSADDETVTGTLQIKDEVISAEAKIVPWYKSIWTYLGVIYGIGIPVLAYVLYTKLHQKTLEKRNMV